VTKSQARSRAHTRGGLTIESASLLASSTRTEGRQKAQLPNM
jgi:hypothetical protein